MLLSCAVCGVLLLDAAVNELHGTAVFYASLIRELNDFGWLSIFEGPRAYFLKPPLVLWMSTASSQAFGLTNLGVTITPRLASVGCVLLTYLIGKTLFNHRVAALAIIMLVTNSTFIQFSATLRMDSTLMLGGLISIFAWLRRDLKYSSALFFGGLTVGVLSKGPLGFAPILIVGLHWLCTADRTLPRLNWHWSWLLMPIFLWYGYLYHLHGASPFQELSADLSKPASAVNNIHDGQTVSAIVEEYLIKPARRFWPWLPFMLMGLVMACFQAKIGRDGGEKATMRWLLIWFAVVFIAAAAKPDKDIRYLYMGLPVLALFGGYALSRVASAVPTRWLSGGLSSLAIALVLIFNFGDKAEVDTRPDISLMKQIVEKTNTPPIALGGYPVRLDLPRRQNTHRDWIYFYLNKEPIVLSWAQLKPSEVQSGDGFFLTNNRQLPKRLKEYGLTEILTTNEMSYAVRR